MVAPPVRYLHFTHTLPWCSGVEQLESSPAPSVPVTKRVSPLLNHSSSKWGDTAFGLSYNRTDNWFYSSDTLPGRASIALFVQMLTSFSGLCILPASTVSQ